VQGLLATVGVPYVGADVTASSIGIDKAAMKASFAARGLPQLGYHVVDRARWEAAPAAVTDELVTRLPTALVRQARAAGVVDRHQQGP
jgi:D-alanine-D-alanine ligase